MKNILSEKIEQSLVKNDRVYLSGKLKSDNSVDHFDFQKYEMGISDYKEFKADAPHVHLNNYEYNYVLEGQIKVLLVEEGKEYTFHRGDIFLIEPNMKYATKCLGGTRILFTKVPGGNDKVLLELSDDLKRWQGGW